MKTNLKGNRFHPELLNHGKTYKVWQKLGTMTYRAERRFTGFWSEEYEPGKHLLVAMFVDHVGTQVFVPVSDIVEVKEL